MSRLDLLNLTLLKVLLLVLGMYECMARQRGRVSVIYDDCRLSRVSGGVGNAGDCSVDDILDKISGDVDLSGGNWGSADAALSFRVLAKGTAHLAAHGVWLVEDSADAGAAAKVTARELARVEHAVGADGAGRETGQLVGGFGQSVELGVEDSVGREVGEGCLQGVRSGGCSLSTCRRRPRCGRHRCHGASDGRSAREAWGAMTAATQMGVVLSGLGNLEWLVALQGTDVVPRGFCPPT
jgi:hypothetical protein